LPIPCRKRFETVVLGACVGLGRTSLGLTITAFDLVSVDEAARCTASELLSSQPAPTAAPHYE